MAFGSIDHQLIQAHPVIALGGAYLAGVATSFTPCVYPVIPITLGVIGARSSSSKSQGFFLSLVYVLGLAITYAVLGAIAALSGTFFGKISSSPWTHLVVGNACLLFGISMISGFSLPYVQIVPQKYQKKREGFIGIFLMGILAGLIVGPCTAPVLATLLVYVGTTQDVVYGFSLLFAFGYGIGFLFILLGSFAGLLAAMPKSGVWMEKIKIFFGWLLVLAAEYLLIKAGGLFI